jgi:hypothetical protein
MDVEKMSQLLRFHLTREIVCYVGCHGAQVGAMITEDCHEYGVCLFVEFEHVLIVAQVVFPTHNLPLPESELERN